MIRRVLVAAAVVAIAFGVGLVVGRSTAPDQAGSGVQGAVKLGGCLGNRCEWVSQRACQLVFRDAHKSAVARFCSRSDGRYRISLPPGGYVIAADEKVGEGLLEPVRLVVRRDTFTSQDLHYDTGMR